MIPNNNLSVLPWYTSIEQQNARKWWVYNRIYPLFTPANMLLPFQIMRRHKVLSALVEQIPAEYSYRRSDASLSNKVQITKFLGRSLVYNQLAKNGDLSQKDVGFSTSSSNNYPVESWSDGVVKLRVANVVAGGLIAKNDSTFNMISGHKYYYVLSVKFESTGNLTTQPIIRFDFYVDGHNYADSITLENGEWVRYSNIYIPTSDLTGVRLRPYISNSSTSLTVGDFISYDTIMVIDLTKMFGAGKEPTVAEFEALYPNGYYPYNTGEIKNNEAQSIQTTGFNQWDEQWESGTLDWNDGSKTADSQMIRSKNFIPVFHTTYFINVASRIFEYDADKNFITSYPASFSTGQFTPYCRYIKFITEGTTYNNDICLNFSDDERNGLYKPYTVTNFPLNLDSFSVKDSQGQTSTIQGLKQAGTVRDEIIGNKLIQRVGTRAYQSSDDTDTTVMTDGTNTNYPLVTPIEYDITDTPPAGYPKYKGELYGTEKALYNDELPLVPLCYEATPYRLLLEFKIFKADGTELADYTEQMNRMLAVKTIDDVDVLVYAANIPFTPSFPNGQYYAVMSDGLNVWYSEVFTAVNDIQPYLKIEWWDTEDFVMDAGVIVYREPNFKNILYLDSDLAKPEYPFEEEGETRDGYFFPIKQISEKHYRFKFFASEYLLDVIRFIRMADYARITYRGQTYSLDTFLITPEWEDNGDVASVEAEFDTATVAKKIGRGYIVPTGGDFNNDYNNDFNNQE